MKRLAIPAELKPEDITAVIDTREQTPLDLSPLRTEAGTLATGDYSIRGLEHFVAIERKSASDLIACVGAERERFDREVQRLLAYPVRCLIVEAPAIYFTEHRWRGHVTPAQVQGSLLGWIAAGLPIIHARDHFDAGQTAAKLLTIAARRRWREARALLGAVMVETDESTTRSRKTQARPPERPLDGVPSIVFESNVNEP
jgi:DNA excision repair protein ERCC-4